MTLALIVVPDPAFDNSTLEACFRVAQSTTPVHGEQQMHVEKESLTW